MDSKTLLIIFWRDFHPRRRPASSHGVALRLWGVLGRRLYIYIYAYYNNKDLVRRKAMVVTGFALRTPNTTYTAYYYYVINRYTAGAVIVMIIILYHNTVYLRIVVRHTACRSTD